MGAVYLMGNGAGLNTKDLAPNVTNLTLTGGNTKIHVSFRGVITAFLPLVRYYRVIAKRGGTPTSPTDGAYVDVLPGTTGNAIESTTLTGLTNGMQYTVRVYIRCTYGWQTSPDAKGVATPADFPTYTYTGQHEFVKESDSNWYIKFKTSGVFTLLQPSSIKIDKCCIGGGGGGDCTAGGCSGYVKHQYDEALLSVIGINVTIGAGGTGTFLLSPGSASIAKNGSPSSYGSLIANGGETGSNVFERSGHAGGGGTVAGPVNGNNGGSGITGSNGGASAVTPNLFGRGDGLSGAIFGDGTKYGYAGGGGGSGGQVAKPGTNGGSGGAPNGGVGGAGAPVDQTAQNGRDGDKGAIGGGGGRGSSSGTAAGWGGGGGGGYGGGGGGGGITSGSSGIPGNGGKGADGIVFIRNSRS